MSGFCPDDWHQTTEADLQQMSWGEDFWLYVPDTMLGFSPVYRAERRAEYEVHDAAIAQAKKEGLTFHLLSDKEQGARMTLAEASLTRARSSKP